MIATAEQTAALRSRYGIDPDLWMQMGAERGHTPVCQDFGLISYARIFLQDESQRFRILMRPARDSWDGVYNDSPAIPHVYLVDLQNRIAYNKGVSWPQYSRMQYEDATFNQLRKARQDKTWEIVAHASSRIIPSVQDNFPPDPPGFIPYSWLRDPQLAAEYLGIRQKNLSQIELNLKLVFAGLSGRLMLEGKSLI